MPQPAGKYKNVNAHSITGGNNLVGGTGTFDPVTMSMSCGPWGPASDRPKVGDFYNISGTAESDNQFYTFDKYKCLSANDTSDFRDANVATRHEKDER
ncbi:MAG TPA: hypothetical protein VGR95_14305 [Thermoanaerobaculia bacterium]|jgi:hypothetical protein|nr:hypothetical protein [Thermoanaerobaculia bacterium]